MNGTGVTSPVVGRTWGHSSGIRLASLKNSRRANHLMSPAALQCKNDIAYEVKPLRPDRMLEGPLRVKLVQFCRVPNVDGRSPYKDFAVGSHCFLDKALGGLPRWCTDADNAMSMLFDSLQGFVYEDDAQIAEQQGKRLWHTADGFMCVVEEI